ncbi:dihydroxyacetone kinase family protein [Corynebacterium lowii]|uniref:PTS-dependent dihydroxyacetone kinase, dihydroxyacetone-binding subunit DhaK n=1 Tax=Corynebacterium lowii TaxID=1544413 RepID=A0A0Q1AJI9_9CORY|nr:dihydroxyacetone kinase family protein [Corynebacterium lowii]KQB87005.1 PTS-dependent dihydroxyacetone kinase, dihydroxyacetone-binding subunit DhaK [Corynebacterium lowii]MDP9852414.1 dihydroxyacetone kinase [Corynebacterium lowii]
MNTPLPSFRNSAADFLPQALGGIIAAHPEARWDERGFIAHDAPRPDRPRVAVISGGGSGHEPLHAGFLGTGMLSAVCPGLLFTSPNAVQITEATRWADQGAGVLHVVKNYTGDVMNFRVARQALSTVPTREVRVAEDVATEGTGDGPGRRGTAATILVEKIAGAAAQRGDTIDAVADLAQWVADNSRSMAVALAPGHLPTTGEQTFNLGEGEMEVGVGIHGERGTSREQAAPAAEIVERLLGSVADSLDLHEGEEVILLFNGLGGTSSLELHLLLGEALNWLAQRGIIVRRNLVGNYVTSVNMAGASLTLSRATSEIIDLIDAPTTAPAWPQRISDKAHCEPARLHAEDTLPTEGAENTWLSGFVRRVQEGSGHLTELDRLAGDGDFGTNMEAALVDIALPLRGPNPEVLDGLSRRFLIRSGGTSGAVLGTLFRELAAALREEDSPAGLATGLDRACAAIAELGGAQRGDGTLLDALLPAAEAVAGVVGGVATGSDGAGGASGSVSEAEWEEALAAAHRAAEEGAESTRNMTAKKGRASYVGEASKGVIDPGALLVAWVFGE